MSARQLQPAQAWQNLGSGNPPPDGVELIRASRDSSVYRLAVGAEQIIAKRCPASTARIERLVYEQFLPHADVRSPHYFGATSDCTADFCWLFVGAVHGKPYHPERPAHRAAAARWLAAIHSAPVSAEAVAGLPQRWPDHYRALLASVTESLSRTRSIPERNQTFAALRRHCDALTARWSELEAACSRTPARLVHGDLVAHNAFLMSVDEGAAFVAFDWEKAAWGTPAEDLAHVDLHVYREVLGQHSPEESAESLRCIAGAGKIFRCLVFLAWLVPDLESENEYAIEQLTLCSTWLDDLMEAEPWLS